MDSHQPTGSMDPCWWISTGLSTSRIDGGDVCCWIQLTDQKWCLVLVVMLGAGGDTYCWKQPTRHLDENGDNVVR